MQELGSSENRSIAAVSVRHDTPDELEPERGCNHVYVFLLVFQEDKAIPEPN